MLIIGATSLIQNRGSRLTSQRGVRRAGSCLDHLPLHADRWDSCQKRSSASLCLDHVHVRSLSDHNLQPPPLGWKQFAAAWNGPRLPLILAAVLGVVAYLLALIAYTFAPLSYSGAIREVSVVIGAFLGWQFLEEKMGGDTCAWLDVIFAGILIIAVFG